jgi:predicted amidohydrolase YtcJ
VGIVGDTIAAVGDYKHVRKAVGPRSEEIDLGGRLLLPGFIDSHVHFLGGGGYLLGLDLRGADDPQEFVRRIREKVEQTAKGKWVSGGRWDTSKWPGRAWPHRDLIDGFSPYVPIFVRRTDGHVGLANSCALRIAGITSETPPPKGGMIDRDRDGRLTGILRDAAMGLVQKHIPEASESEKEEMIRAALDHAASLGVTSVNDLESPALKIYQKLLDAERLTCRINYWHGISRWENIAAIRLWPGFGNDLLRIGGVKAFVDGSLGARTALMFEPYNDDPGNTGPALEWTASGKLEQQMLACDSAGIQMAVHAIGDKANALLLDIIESLVREKGRRDRRIRIEHAQHLRADDFARFARLDVIASVQPSHILLDAPWAERALGHDRASRTYAFRSLLDAGVRVAFGSDWPVVPLNPMETIYAAVTRIPLDGSCPSGWIPEQCVTVEEAIRCYTAESAYAEFQERRQGSIAPGKLADLVVLSENILEIDPKSIKDVKIDMTVVGGRIVYQREAS